MKLVYGRNLLWREQSLETNLQGMTEQVNRWVKIDDIWEDYDTSVCLIKYLDSHKVSRGLWIDDYIDQWFKEREENKDPLNNIQWKVGEDL